MPETIITSFAQHFVGGFIAAVIGFIAGIITLRTIYSRQRSGALTAAQEIIHRAEQDAETKIREAEIKIKEKTIQIKEKNEEEFRNTRQELHNRERSLDKRQDTLDKQADDQRKQEKIVENNQRKLTERIAEVNRRTDELADLLEKQRSALHDISGLSLEEAVRRLLKLLEDDLQQETGALVVKYERQLKEQSEVLSKNILLASMQRYAAAHTAESTTSTVDIPSDEMKGRIIGREGRNIRTFEKITGVEIIIDDTPGVVIVSCFDPVRREVARLSLTRLITDGRIHPARIEEIVAETNKDIQNIMQRTGAEACQELDIFGLNERLVHLLGRLHFRTSFSQNVLRHSIEVAFISGLIAVELGLNVKLARRCGLLHDIGKAADHEIEGGHPKIGADILKRYGEPQEVIHAALGHHDDAKVENPYTVIVAIADACSASRPGARRESLENYVKRMEELEAIANEFTGVEQSFAVQAGREMRIMVNAEKVTDEAAAKVCRDIAKALTERVQFPGEIKVTVIREVHFSETAK
ncbi:MAG: ribonuclease Y [Planctomycetaceae bacterium]|nr:ribonuclease Y [Planctomycetaceae bacterium]